MPWIPEVAAARNRVAAISVLAGQGSGVYTRLFEDPQRFLRLLKEAETKAHRPFGEGDPGRLERRMRRAPPDSQEPGVVRARQLR
jgi:hypothetical protein